MLAPSPSELHMGNASTIRCLPSCPANLRDIHRLGNGGAHGRVLLLQIRIAMQNSQHSYRPFPMYLWAMKQNPLFICAFVLVSTSLALDVSARVKQDIDGPFAYTETPPKSVSNARPHVVRKRTNGKVQAAYFSNWCVLCWLESLHSGLVTD
jgi:hypothetical protein